MQIYTHSTCTINFYFTGVYYNTTVNRLYVELDRAVSVVAHGLEAFYSDPKNFNVELIPNLTCNGTGQQRWTKGDLLFR